jgi:DNA repair protein RAD7
MAELQDDHRPELIGLGKMAAEDSLSSLVSSEDEPDLDPVHSKETQLNPGSVSASTMSYRRQTSKERAIGLAPEFAFFKADKDEHSEDDDEEPCPDSQDWPGSFVTAVRMYEAREAKLRARELNSSKLNKSASRVIV